MTKRCLFATIAALCLLYGHARAGTLTSTSYSYTNGTPAGESVYTDPSGTLLTDGVLGTLNNVQDGTWVFWQSTGVPEITFNFASPVTVNTVSLYMYVGSQANTALPESVAINGGSVTSSDTLPLDPDAGFINYTGTWTGNTLVLDLGHSTNHWIGISEVKFSNNSGSSTPEPGTFMLLGAALRTIGGTRYRRLFRQP